jgi:DNA mismatch repair ATPase MutS
MAALARAQEQLQASCAAAWSQLLQDFTASHHAAFREAVAAVAQLDALQGLSVVAAQQGYCRPQVCVRCLGWGCVCNHCVLRATAIDHACTCVLHVIGAAVCG